MAEHKNIIEKWSEKKYSMRTCIEHSIFQTNTKQRKITPLTISIHHPNTKACSHLVSIFNFAFLHKICNVFVTNVARLYLPPIQVYSIIFAKRARADSGKSLCLAVNVKKLSTKRGKILIKHSY